MYYNELNKENGGMLMLVFEYQCKIKFLKSINQKSNNRGIGLRHARAMILSNATRALKKALKDEWQKRQNVREHEKLVEESIDI